MHVHVASKKQIVLHNHTGQVMIITLTADLQLWSSLDTDLLLQTAESRYRLNFSSDLDLSINNVMLFQPDLCVKLLDMHVSNYSLRLSESCWSVRFVPSKCKGQHHCLVVSFFRTEVHFALHKSNKDIITQRGWLSHEFASLQNLSDMWLCLIFHLDI